jgi:hypothetical protein
MVSVLISTSLFCIEQSSTYNKSSSLPLPPASVLNFTINVQNRQDAASNNSTHIAPHQEIINKNPEFPLFNKAAQLFDSRLNQLGHSSSHFFSTYKWHLLAASIAGSYAYICYIIVSGNRYLSQNTLWSSWRQDLALDQLLAIPQAQMAQELLREIQRRYTDAGSITDLVRPLGLFMTHIDQEEEQLKSYQTTFSWLSYLRLAKLIPFSKIRFTKIAERLQRIAYYKNVFQSWAADYQLENAARQPFAMPRSPQSPPEDLAQLAQEGPALHLQNYWQKHAQTLIPPYQ